MSRMRVAEDGEDLLSHADDIFGRIEADDLDGCALLIEADPSIANSTDKQQATPLHAAVRQGKVDIVKYLIQSSNIDINAADSKGNIPLHYACMEGYEDIAILLISCAADVNASNKDKMSPLHCAARAGKATICQLLIQEKADINMKERRSFTPLHFAAQGGYLDVVQLLLSNNADPHARTDRNKAPSEFAQLPSIREVIEKAEASVPAPPASDAAPPSATGKKGKSSICFAFQKNECQYGDKCRFLHMSAEEEQAALIMKNELKRKESVQKEAKPSTRSNKVCYAWQKGECDRGENCRFMHSELTPAIEHAVAVVEDDAPKTRKSKSGKGYIRMPIRSRVCFAYLRGGCDDTDCKFLHLNVHHRIFSLFCLTITYRSKMS